MAKRTTMRILFVAFLVHFCVQSVMADVERKLIMTFMGQCKGKEDLPVYLPDFKIEQTNRNRYYMSGDIILREPYPKGFSVFIDIKKCTNPSVADTCKTFLNNMATTDICTMLDLPLPSYSSFVRSLKPPLKCPLRQTTYHMENFEVEDSLTKYMPVSRSISYWNVTITARHHNKEVACVLFQMHARPIAKQSRRN